MLDRQQLSTGTHFIGNQTSYCNRSVWFAVTDADQLLLQTIDHLLEAGDYSSFSELCKQALRAWLLPDDPQADSTLIVLQQQIVALQLQVNQLSQQLSQAPAPAPAEPIVVLEAQVTALMERVAHLEQCAAEGDPLELPQDCTKIAVPGMPVREADPLLNRLVALLEDF
ncbi:ribbon-helix-helix domain-containing protein [Leptolyngbya sp. GB1-A1]|uniref:ribbon-helix-helix domain-containing protein n=1 Tax=Leptolyngbya sp. GB1-A1 TaxID=2933908 RepID=UPI00329A59DB